MGVRGHQYAIDSQALLTFYVNVTCKHACMCFFLYVFICCILVGECSALWASVRVLLVVRLNVVELTDPLSVCPSCC